MIPKMTNTQIDQNVCKLVKIRRAVESDSKDIWKWRNDPITKAQCINTDLISWDLHDDWYKRSLQNPDRFLYIGTDKNNNKIGVCRFDIAEKEVEISINLNPEFRNKNLSKSLLSNALFQFNKFSNADFLARIKHLNIASQRIFQKVGFTQSGHDIDFVYYQYQTQSKSKPDIDKLKLIDQIELIRSNNNINWMNLLRLSFQVAPEDAKLLFRKINADDQKISELFNKLAE
jgi:RimJ/RimL family protein N-acetyltransferase